MEEKKDLELNTDSIAGRSGVRSSLTDINQLQIFSDEFEERKANVDNVAAEEELALRNTVFGLQIRQTDNIELTDKLFSNNTSELIIRNEQTVSEEQISGIMPGIYIIIVLIIIWIGIRMRWRELKKNHVDNQFKTVI
ncbi:MAG: hypothetical protein J1F18_03530 [Lachnospiraceae bacterium]|nr:hypothetical protein [Lachnospiraceae bacterium]